MCGNEGRKYVLREQVDRAQAPQPFSCGSRDTHTQSLVDSVLGPESVRQNDES